jgi:RHS repeat-associated protein
VEEVDASGNVLVRYTEGPGIDEPLAMQRGVTTSFYEADGLGSITSLTSTSGALAATYIYDSFGRVTASTGTVTNRFQYTGREFDAETGLNYYRARYYDASIGRFLSEDPAQFEGGLNFYGYVGNSPIDHIDPTGLWSTAAHDQIIWNALYPCGVSAADIWDIQQGSRFADSDVFQGAQYSYMHAMRDGTDNQSVTSAQQQTAAFIWAGMAAAKNSLSAGANDQAMVDFGLAMHPVMDVTSPAHTDANGNPIPWCGMLGSCSHLLKHGDSPWSIEDLNHLNSSPDVQNAENFLIRTFFQTLTGKQLRCCSQ